MRTRSLRLIAVEALALTLLLLVAHALAPPPMSGMSVRVAARTSRRFRRPSMRPRQTT